MEQKHPFRFLAANFLIITGLNKYKHFTFNGYKIGFSKSAMSLSLFMDSKDRAEEYQFLKDLLRTGDIVVDAGANIGTLTIPSALYCGNGKVLSIEAHPTTFGFLKENIALNKMINVIAINMAVGDKDGAVNFSNASNDDQNKISKEGGGINVPMTSLDKLLPQHGTSEITLLKIDVEGFEKFVFEGAAATLEKTNAVFFEVWEKSFQYYNYSFADIFALLKAKGFKVYKFNSDTEIAPVDATFSAAVCQNVLAVKDIAWFTLRTGYQVVN
jgi:FkbM family methyltransferase